MADPRLYTDFDSCVQPMRRGELIIGYRRIGVRALVRNALLEKTTVDIGLNPFGLYIYQNGSPAALPAGSIDAETRTMIAAACKAQSHVSQSVLESVCAILHNLVPSHIHCSGASKVKKVGVL